MSEVVAEPQGAGPTDGHSIEKAEEPLTLREALKVAGLVILGILVLLLLFGVFRYLLVSEYGGF